MCQKTTICVRELARVTVNLVSLALPGYGSLDLATLEQLNNELLNVVRGSDFRTIVLDLGKGKVLGAGFLQAVENLRRALAAEERTLILAGDDGGLVAAAGWTRRVPHYPELVDALNAAALSTCRENEIPLAVSNGMADPADQVVSGSHIATRNGNATPSSIPPGATATFPSDTNPMHNLVAIFGGGGEVARNRIQPAIEFSPQSNSARNRRQPHSQHRLH